MRLKVFACGAGDLQEQVDKWLSTVGEIDVVSTEQSLVSVGSTFQFPYVMLTVKYQDKKLGTK